jgi:hypothetical protein
LSDAVEEVLWIKAQGSNLLVPANAGAQYAVASSSSISFLENKERAAAVAQMYRDAGIQLSLHCDLGKHVAAAGLASDMWLSGCSSSRFPVDLIFRGIQMDRIATSILAAKGSAKIGEYLRAFARGSVDVFDRKQSKAKNLLWELELHALLRSQSVSVELEEPDIVAKLEGENIGIACKKIYSHANVEKALSTGVDQIERVSEYGILAINLDDLRPPNTIRVSTSARELGHSLTQENLTFLDQHDRHFRKYLSTGRVMGALVAAGGIGYVDRAYQSARQFTVWSMPNLHPAKAALLDKLAEQIRFRW